jgi:hypothetical protein
LSERFELYQGEKLIARTGVIEPGYGIEWAEIMDSPEVGPAVATVYAVRDGADSGNPVSVEVEVVPYGFVAPGTE